MKKGGRGGSFYRIYKDRQLDIYIYTYKTAYQRLLLLGERRALAVQLRVVVVHL